MSRQPSRFPYMRQVRSGRNHQHWMDHDNQMLHEEINSLNFLINQTRAQRSEQSFIADGVYNQLEETRAQLARQKSLTEMFINRGIEQKKELESMVNCTDAETVRVAQLGFEVQTEIKYKMKKVLHVHYDELREEHINSQEKFSAELQTIQQKNKTFQEELDRTRTSYQELNKKYETDNLAERQKAETLQQELKREMKSHAEKMEQDQEFIKNLRADQNTIRKNMKRKITALQEISKDTEMRLTGEVKRMKLSYGELSSKYDTDVLPVRKQADSYQQQLDREVQAHVQTGKKNAESFNQMKAEQETRRQTMGQELTFLRQTLAEQERVFQTQIQGLKTQLKRQISLTDELSAELQDRDDSRRPRKRARREEQNQEQVSIPVFFPEPEPPKKIQLSEETIPQTGNNEPEPKNVTPLSQQTVPETTDIEPEPVDVTRVSDDNVAQTSTKNPSFWKKTRHFLGLRKPEKWKKKNGSNEKS